jgi:hypothetical protein
VSGGVDDLSEGGGSKGLGGSDNWSRVGKRSCQLVGNDWSSDGGVSKGVVSEGVVSKGAVSEGVVSEGSNGQWSSGDGNLSLGTGAGFSVGGEVSGSGSNNLWGISNWEWSSQLGNWGKGKSVGFGSESTMSSNVVDADFFAVGVDVSVASADIASSITDSGMSLSWFAVSV